jgi:hypothetical protein
MYALHHYALSDISVCKRSKLHLKSYILKHARATWEDASLDILCFHVPGTDQMMSTLLNPAGVLEMMVTCQINCDKMYDRQQI